MKNLVVPYHLYMRIACELNDKIFVIIVVSNNKNLLKPGFQYICDAIGIDNIESSLSIAINICYQSTFKIKTEYSGLSVMGFDNEIIIQSLINDIVFFPIFTRIEKLTVVITNVESECIKTIIEETPDEIWKKLEIF
ncbi:3832_t:CDS:2 [Gigaspora margarita]|uniref:3832_t:CDS:1 n=1 Tax=Gigaspora margarita TaxID=4874 RepID=A0ABN7ULT9_GIGMA|nr:3832_t:CDS:2 [Gigaspora margarita]